MSDKFYVYILLCFDNTLYTGYTTNLTHRLAVHNAKKGAKYTRGRTPVTLVYSETLVSKSQALKREIELKKLTRQEKLTLIAENMPKEKFNLLFQKG